MYLQGHQNQLKPCSSEWNLFNLPFVLGYISFGNLKVFLGVFGWWENRYIAPELVPVQYGGLKKDGDSVFSDSDPVTLVTIKPGSKHVIEFPNTEVFFYSRFFNMVQNFKI